MVKDTAISSVSLPLFLWVPPLLWEPSYFCKDSCGCVGTLTSSGSPPLPHALPHFCGHILMSVSVPTSVGSQTQQVLLISMLTPTEAARNSRRRGLCPGKSLAV